MFNSSRLLLVKRYLCHARKHRGALAGIILCMIMAAFLEPLLALMLKPLLDGGPDFFVSRQWIPYCAGGVMIILPAVTYGRAYLGGWLDITMQRDFRRDMAAHLIQQPLGAISQEKSGKTISRFMSFVPSMTGPTLPVLTALVQEPLKVLFYLAQMFYLQWQLALLICLAMPPTAILIRYLGKRMKKVASQAQEETARVQTRLSESLTLMPIIKVHGQKTAHSRLSSAFVALRSALLRVQIVIAAGQPLSMLAMAIPFVIILFYIVEALDSQAMTVGDVAAFMGCMLLMPRSVRAITRSATLLEGMLVAAREVFGFLDTLKEKDAGTQTLSQIRGEIVFDNVSLYYSNSEKAALSGISATIAAGDTIALVGRSGAGKTSLANLTPRFYAPQEGTIKIDGKDINTITLASLRQHISLVTQDTLLFDDSLAANVSYPESPQDRDKIARALQDAAAQEFVKELPQGMDSPVGENGRLLSGGQRQRIALARAFYRDSPIVILDEATSALDAQAESKIREAARRLLVGRTVIIITHRFSIAGFADKIWVLDDGKLIAQGRSEELMQTCSLYAELYRAQNIK